MISAIRINYVDFLTDGESLRNATEGISLMLRVEKSSAIGSGSVSRRDLEALSDLGHDSERMWDIDATRKYILQMRVSVLE
jgi:hypothetical protein